MHGQKQNFNIFDIAEINLLILPQQFSLLTLDIQIKELKIYFKAINSNLIHSYAYINRIRLKYISKLIKFAEKGFEKAFLMSAGTEATEAAFKLMRMYGQKVGKRRLGIICFEGNWHGRTMASQMMSGDKKQKEWIGFHDKDVHHIAFPYPWLIKNKSEEQFLENSIKKLKKKIDLKKDICGVMVETFQGWGAIFYPNKYIKLLNKICKK